MTAENSLHIIAAFASSFSVAIYPEITDNDMALQSTIQSLSLKWNVKKIALVDYNKSDRSVWFGYITA